MLVNRGSGSTPWSSDVAVTQTETTDSPPHPRPNPLMCCLLLPLLLTTNKTDCQKQGVKISDVRIYSCTDQLCVNAHTIPTTAVHTSNREACVCTFSVCVRMHRLHTSTRAHTHAVCHTHTLTPNGKVISVHSPKVFLQQRGCHDLTLFNMVPVKQRLLEIRALLFSSPLSKCRQEIQGSSEARQKLPGLNSLGLLAFFMIGK